MLQQIFASTGLIILCVILGLIAYLVHINRAVKLHESSLGTETLSTIFVPIVKFTVEHRTNKYKSAIASLQEAARACNNDLDCRGIAKVGKKYQMYKEVRSECPSGFCEEMMYNKFKLKPSSLPNMTAVMVKTDAIVNKSKPTSASDGCTGTPTCIGYLKENGMTYQMERKSIETTAWVKNNSASKTVDLFQRAS